MNDYTPDLSDAQSYYAAGRAQLRRQITGEQAIDVTEYSHEFDRMIAEVERAAAEKAYERGRLDERHDCNRYTEYQQGRISEKQYQRDARSKNPYRREETE